MKIDSEKIESDHHGARSEEDIRFFQKLAVDLEKKYHLEVHEDAEFLILKIGTKDVYVPKWRKVPTEGGQLVEIQDIIQEIIKENNIKKRDKKEAV
jgi:hypothetical protein